MWIEKIHLEIDTDKSRQSEKGRERERTVERKKKTHMSNSRYYYLIDA